MNLPNFYIRDLNHPGHSGDEEQDGRRLYYDTFEQYERARYDGIQGLYGRDFHCRPSKEVSEILRIYNDERCVEAQPEAV